MSTTPILPGIAFDASQVFPSLSRDIPVISGDLPPGAITIYVPPGVSPIALRESDVDRNYIWEQGWYDTEPWAAAPLPEGVYRLRFPLPDSANKAFADQKAMLLPNEELAPLALVELAMVYLMQAHLGMDLLKTMRIRCSEKAALDFPVEVSFEKGRIYISAFPNDLRTEWLWAASARRIS